MLELLLVVGVAALLILAGIGIYSLVNRGNKVSESIKLVNIIYEQTRKLANPSGNLYGSGTGLEAALARTLSVPEKYIDTGFHIQTPGLPQDDANVVITGNGSLNTFTLTLRFPGHSIVEIAPHITPARYGTILATEACGVTITRATVNTTAFDPATLANSADCRGNDPATLIILSE